jgi:SAM-dependent methyltransferase
MAVDIFPIPADKPLEPFEQPTEGVVAAEQIRRGNKDRYFFALQFCEEKEVLVLSSGEGYGAALLGLRARRVMGVDQSLEAVSQASSRYSSERVSFLASDYGAFPLSDASLDVVVSFETLEEVSNRENFFCEIKRILRPAGVLVMSVRNTWSQWTTLRSDKSQAEEFAEVELCTAISQHFSHCRFFGEWPATDSVNVGEVPFSGDGIRHQTIGAEESGPDKTQKGGGSPTHLIAVASETGFPEVMDGLFDEQRYLRDLGNSFERRATALAKMEELLRVTVRNRDTIYHQLRSRESELSEANARLSQVSMESGLQENELAQSRLILAAIQSSASWRLTSPLRYLRQTAETIRVQGLRLVERIGKGGMWARLLSPDKTAEQSGAAPAQVDAAKLENELQILRESGLFDEQFYREGNPDIGAGEGSLLEHYLTVGAFEGRRPNRLFDSAYYLLTYPEVAKAGVNPLLHYFLNGSEEGRDPSGDFDTSYYLENNPDVRAKEINPLVHFLRFGIREGRFPTRESYERDLERLGRLTAARYRQEKLVYRPLISVLMQTCDTLPVYLEAAVQSVIGQAYNNWELCLVEDASSNSATLRALEQIESLDNRITIFRNADHRGISGARNHALQSASGEYIALLGSEDELAFDALYEVALSLNTDRTTDVIYTDEDCLSADGKLTNHLFKPDWSPSLLRGTMYVGHLLVVRRSLALAVGGFEPAFDGVQDFEFMLRISERTRKIGHLPLPLYRYRENPESPRPSKQLQGAAVQAQLKRLGLEGVARSNPDHANRTIIEHVGRPLDINFDLFVYGGEKPAVDVEALVSELTRAGYQPAGIAVPADSLGVENMTSDETGGHQLSEAERLSRFLSESAAEFVLAVSAHVVIDTEGWFERLAILMQEGDVVAACPLVLSVDRAVAHAGLIIGVDGSVRPAMSGLEPAGDGYLGSLSSVREISAAWADVILLRRSAIAALLPSKSVYFTADFQVADLTLRATRKRLRVLCVPYVRVRQSAKREIDQTRRLDALLFQDHWAANAGGDRFYSPNIVGPDGEGNSMADSGAHTKAEY